MPRHLAYPYGYPAAVCQREVGLARTAGFASAAGAAGGGVTGFGASAAGAGAGFLGSSDFVQAATPVITSAAAIPMTILDIGVPLPP